MSGLPDQAQEDDKGWIDTYNQAYDALAARLSALEATLLLADKLADRVDAEDAGADDWGRWNELVAYRDARAASTEEAS